MSVLLVVGRAASSTSKLPQFSGFENEAWIAQESGTAGRADLLPAFDGRVRIGCTKPTTLAACNSLLDNIAQARD
jgi:hypothetical protein